MISAIVLAAGTSSRMKGSNKLLLPLSGRPSVQIVVENVLASGVEEVIVVTGHESAQVQHLLKSLPVKFVRNDLYQKGLTTSIQKGVSVAKGDGYMICLSDMPFISGEDYLLMKTFFEIKRKAHSACICIPVYKGKRGNPVIFSSFYKEAILQHTDMKGCKGLLQAHSSAILHIELKGDSILRDIDTGEDYLLALSQMPEDSPT